jgi:hypothetical protein
MVSCKPRATHEEFLVKLNKVHPNREWEVIGKYEFNKTPILLRDKYGDCLIPPNNLLQSSRPSVKTAVDKTAYTINKFKELWGDRYDYSEFVYLGARKKSTIICKTHGRFVQDANMHLSGRCGCSKCAVESISSRVRSNTAEFIKKAILKYGEEKYSFNKTVYETATSYVTITCNKHGDFEQTPNRFLNGQICQKCSYKENTANYHILKKKKNKSVFYILECFNDSERFIKLGVTSNNVWSRFREKGSMPYDYTVLREFQYANMDAPDKIETELLRFTKSARYYPKLYFSGISEARTLSIRDALLDYFDVCADHLYLQAFINFSTAYGGVFYKDILLKNYSKVEIDSVLKGYEIYLKDFSK